MANLDNPNGFIPYGPPGSCRKYQVAAAQTIAIGDFVSLDGAKQVVLATATSTELLGICAEKVAAPAAGTYISVYDDPTQLFRGQCSGTFALTALGNEVDIEGTTGIQEVNENATLRKVLSIIGIQGAGNDPDNIIGAWTKVYVRIAKHCLAEDITSGVTNFGAQGLSTDLIVEATGGSGVTIDSVLAKDGAVVTGANVVNKMDHIAEVTGAHGVRLDHDLNVNGKATIGAATGDLACVKVTTTGDLSVNAKASITALTGDIAGVKGTFSGDLACAKCSPSGDFSVNAKAGITAATGDLACVKLDATGDANLVKLTTTGDLSVNAKATIAAASGDLACAKLSPSGDFSVNAKAGITAATGDLAAVKATLTGDLDVGGAKATIAAASGDLACAKLTATGDTDIGGGKAKITAATGAVACGPVTITGDFSYTGHKDGQMLLGFSPRLPNPAAQWAADATYAIHLPAAVGPAKCFLEFAGLKVGDELISGRWAGAVAETTGLTLDGNIVKMARANGALTVLAAFTQQAGPTGSFVETKAFAAEVVTEDFAYGIEPTATTQAADTIDIRVVGCGLNQK